MIRKFIQQINQWLEYRLRRIVAPLSPDARVILILSLLLIFGGLSIYMTVSSIYEMGRKSGRMQIEHIKRLELVLPHKSDRIIPLNPFEL